MCAHMCMCSLRLIAIGNIQDIKEIVNTMLHLNDITVVMGGRIIARAAIPEEMVVVETVAIVEDTDKQYWAFMTN